MAINTENGIKASEKPISDNMSYVYAEDENKNFVRIQKETLKSLLGIATRLSELKNDAGFVDRLVSDLENYYKKSETYTREEIDDKLALVPRFSVQVVSSGVLPTENISETTVYLIPSSAEDDNLYTEFIYVNGLWEILGTQKIASVENAVLYTEQSLTDEQKTQARSNIGAASALELSQLEEQIDNLVLTGGGVTNAQRNSLIAVIEAIGVFNVANGQQLIDDFKSAWEITIEATKITLDKTVLSFDVAVSQTLTATVEPSGTTEKVIWHSSNESIATVVNGVVNPISNGSCTITATCGKVSASCEVTVNVESEIVTYTITNNLTNVTTDNPSVSISENSSYMATLTPSAEYEFETVVITMNGVDITDIAYSDGVITIESVTGNVVITASAVEQSSGEVTLLKNIAFDGSSYIDTEVIPENTSYRYVFGLQMPSKEFASGYIGGVSMRDHTDINKASYWDIVWNCAVKENGYNANVPSVDVSEIRTTSSAKLNSGQDNGDNLSNQPFDYPMFYNFGNDVQSLWMDEELTIKPTGGSFSKLTNNISTADNSDKHPVKPIWLGKVNLIGIMGSYNSPFANVKFYCFKVYDENDNLIADMKPAKQGSIIGMYCNVREKFFAGNGTLTYEELEVA